MIVLGIDPGYERVGVSVLEKMNNKEFVLYSTCIKTSKNLEFSDRLSLISKEISEVIEKYKPEVLSIENLFFNKNQKTVMRVSEVRGAIINICLSKKLEVREFTPLQIKVAITGHGRSDKKQVIRMTENLVSVKSDIKTDDEYDAIAVALTYLASERVLSSRNQPLP